MSRYIDADALRHEMYLQNCVNKYGQVETTITKINIAFEHCTVDAVPVVRCKNCEYFKGAKVNGNGFLICTASGMEITEDDFCSYGEKVTE